MLWGIKYTAFVSEVLLMSQLLTFKLLEWDCGRYDYSIRSCMRCIWEVGQGALEVQYSFGGLPRWQTRCYHATSKYYLRDVVACYVKKIYLLWISVSDADG